MVSSNRWDTFIDTSLNVYNTWFYTVHRKWCIKKSVFCVTCALWEHSLFTPSASVSQSHWSPFVFSDNETSDGDGDCHHLSTDRLQQVSHSASHLIPPPACSLAPPWAILHPIPGAGWWEVCMSKLDILHWRDKSCPITSHFQRQLQVQPSLARIWRTQPVYLLQAFSMQFLSHDNVSGCKWT